MSNNDVAAETKLPIYAADILTAMNLLYLITVNDCSVWFNEEQLPPADIDMNADFMRSEKSLLTFEQVQQLYPHLFK